MAVPKTLSAQDIIAKSGHTFHSKVVTLFRKLGWYVAVSPFYSDNFTDKPREIDIIAEKAFAYSNHFDSEFGDVYLRLFIECKYVSTLTVFWFDAKDIEQAISCVVRQTGWKEPQAYAAPYQLHHLANNGVAKLFDSGRSRGEDNEAFSRAINQTLNGLVYYRARPSLALRRRSGRRTLLTMTFPLIALNSFSELQQTHMNEPTTTLPILEPFQLEVNYAYKANENDRSEYFLIDVVALDMLPAFLESLEQNEVQAMLQNLSRR